MRWFIVHLRAEKLQYFAYPDILDARADADAIGVNENLTQCVVNLAPTLISKAHVEFCIGVPKQIHVFCCGAVCKFSDDHPMHPLQQDLQKDERGAP